MDGVIKRLGQLPRLHISRNRVSSQSLEPEINICDMLKRREMGAKPKTSFKTEMTGTLYGKYDEYTFDGRPKSPEISLNGGLITFEYCWDGRKLVVGTENGTVDVYDSNNHKRFLSILRGHSCSITCITFLSEFKFAACAIDCTLKIWDSRRLKNSMQTLSTGWGHSFIDVEYAKSQGLILTSSYDGSINVWTMRPPRELDLLISQAVVFDGPTNIKLTPDESKLIIASGYDYIMIIHDLNIKCLKLDLGLFNPDAYRNMQRGKYHDTQVSSFEYVFHPNRSRNRVEFITDFPHEASIVRSLQVHPQGLAILTRSTNPRKSEEMTSVFDIRDKKRPESDFGYYIPVENKTQSEIELIDDTYLYDEEAVKKQINDEYFGRGHHLSKKIISNVSRLTHYTYETSLGLNYAKAVSFSADGKVVASPYNCGLRLFGFNDVPKDYIDCIGEESECLRHLVQLYNYHSGIVLTCKFHPKEHQLVSGDSSGELQWYRPVL